MIKYALFEPDKQGIKINESQTVTKVGNSYIFDYPCEDSSNCTDYAIDLHPGAYIFELYGASGGSTPGYVSTYHFQNNSCLSDTIVQFYKGNTKCLSNYNFGGAGGYVQGTIFLKRHTKIYATIAGSGKYEIRSNCAGSIDCFQPENMVRGGYGGGGSSSGFKDGSASGGGATSVKFLENTLYHRVIVSGGGGGSDDSHYGIGDGRGGSGGGLIAQGWWEDQIYKDSLVANSTFGFTFGSGEAAHFGDSLNQNSIKRNRNLHDLSGGGGGWFGGFSSNYQNAGSGGGRSWALTSDAIIPPGNIASHDEFY